MLLSFRPARSPLNGVANALRAHVLAGGRRLPATELVAGFLLCVTRVLGRDVEEQFRASGLTHLLAVWGANATTSPCMRARKPGTYRGVAPGVGPNWGVNMAGPERHAVEADFDEVVRRSVEGEESWQVMRAWAEADYWAFHTYCEQLSAGDGSEPSDV